MTIADILAPGRVRFMPGVHSKKRALEQLADILAEGTPYLTAADVFNGLIKRERLGGTGVGDGVAVPHARLKGLDESIGALIRLPRGVDFATPDKQPVDLIFGLIVPAAATDEHHKLLRRLADILADADTVAALRRADNDTRLHQTLIDHDTIPV